MKLRLLVLLLVLANGALFAWGWMQAGAPHASGADTSSPLQRQIRPDAVRVEPAAPQAGVALAHGAELRQPSLP